MTSPENPDPLTDVGSTSDAGPPPSFERVPWWLQFLFRVDAPLWRYILCATCASFFPAAAIAHLLAYLGLLTDRNGPVFEGSPEILFVSLVFVAPFVETLFMAGLLWIISRFIAGPFGAALLSALIWAGLHSLAAPLWGIPILWAFFIFSSACLAWSRKSWLHALFVPFAIHGLHNLIPAMFVLLLPTS